MMRRTLQHKYAADRRRARRARSRRSRRRRARALVDALRREIAAAWETEEVRRERPSPLDEVRGGAGRLRADAVGRGAGVTCASLDRTLCAASPAGGCRSTPRRSASARGSAAIATATRTSRPRSRGGPAWLARWPAADALPPRDRCAARRAVDERRRPTELRARAGTRTSRIARCCATCATRLLATRDCASRRRSTGAERSRARRLTSIAARRRSGRAAAPLPSLAARRPATADRRRPAAPTAAPRRRVRPHARAARHPAGRRRAHRGAIASIARHAGLGAYDGRGRKTARVAFLAGALAAGAPLVPADLPPDSPRSPTCSTRSGRSAALPPESLGAYVITMARRPSDVLAVECLQRCAGAATAAARRAAVRDRRAICDAAGAVARSACSSMPWYRERIAAAGIARK